MSNNLISSNYLQHFLDFFALMSLIDNFLTIYFSNVSIEVNFDCDETELMDLIQRMGNNLMQLDHINICGLMGMASFTNDKQIVESEFSALHAIYNRIKSTVENNINISVLSMGMSNDYATAIAQGSNMVRIGSMLFGSRN